MILNTRSEPLVSIIVNCKDGKKYLSSCIDSIVSQTYTNWEIIFWDNNSQDNSKKILNNYSDPRVKYFKSEKILGSSILFFCCSFCKVKKLKRFRMKNKTI